MGKAGLYKVLKGDLRFPDAVAVGFGGLACAGAGALGVRVEGPGLRGSLWTRPAMGWRKRGAEQGGLDLERNEIWGGLY